MKPLIIGYGNPLRGDDGLGQVVVSRLPPALADTHICHQLTIDLAPRLTAYDRVILVDAYHATPPGHLYTEVITPTTDYPLVHHHLTPDLLLTFAQTLYGATPHMIRTGLTATAFDVGTALSPPIQAQLPTLEAHITRLVHLSHPQQAESR